MIRKQKTTTIIYICQVISYMNKIIFIFFKISNHLISIFIFLQMLYCIKKKIRFDKNGMQFNRWKVPIFRQ